MKKTFLALLGIGLLFNAGCSTVIKGNNDRIVVTSLEDDTVIHVDGAPRGKGTVSVDVKRGQPHDLIAKKAGCQDAVAKTTESFDATTLLGILIDFGIITIPIDLISGAAWKQNPTTYTLTPICPTKASTPATVTQ